MKISKIDSTENGWFIGNFPKAIYQTKGVEVSYRIHKAGDLWDWHYHEHLDEINLLISGSMLIQDTLIESGDVFILERMEIADPVFIEDCEIVCVKLPNFTNDKIVIKKGKNV